MNDTNLTKKIDNLIFDVGMHKGEDTDYYLKKGFEVIGFEADPDLAAYCRRRFSSEIENGKFRIIEGAIVETKSGYIEGQTVKFYKNKKITVWGTVVDEWAQRNEILGASSDVIDVAVVDFAQCLMEFGIPHYLKVDIEGADLICIRALLNFEQKPDYVSVESETEVFAKLVAELDMLTQLGYTKFKAVQQAGISSQSEPNPAKEGCYVGYQFQDGSSGLFGEDLPNRWKNYHQVINDYRSIFLLYKLFGDNGKLSQYTIGKIFTKILRRILWKLFRIPLPGWYDTHAKHSSIVS
jgi:FkbM family methyltransferase